MLEKYSVRTDLALEEKERFESDNVEVQGVVLEEEYDEEREIRVSRERREDYGEAGRYLPYRRGAKSCSSR